MIDKFLDFLWPIIAIMFAIAFDGQFFDIFFGFFAGVLFLDAINKLYAYLDSGERHKKKQDEVDG